MSRSSTSRSYFWGIVLIVLGLLFLFQNLNYLDVGEIIGRYWPVILILIGLKMLLAQSRKTGKTTSSGIKAATANRESAGAEPFQSASSDSHNSVFGDVRLRFDNRTMGAYSLSNVFGDIVLDFTGSTFENDSNVRISGVFGDVDIRLPQNLRLQVRANYVGGSSHIFEDYQSGLFKNVLYNNTDIQKEGPMVHINVSIVFGDIRIHN